ncbi:MAG TPA: bifunctional glutamate N-acetyltransferase/amino-acid acetyltransferase ArgJ [Candidatus Binataceae bacterium]|jgi:glutamate N-acetyltransferase/amino-acid N-acetyltransferase|nr:bifunctional glutamate N-acetyltransferase/amino-acid acetyltransferase ArgJ [Candidatus Binataceae bacterium]
MDVILEPRPVKGFRFAGVAAGLRKEPGRKDLGIIVAERPAAAAGVFTTNRVKAAPVLVAQERVRRGRLQAIAVNSGSANCFTGRAGIKLAQDSCAALAAGIGCAAEAVAPCSTGVIGHLYELEKYRAGIRHAIGALSADGLDDFARAIMTTDTRPKTASAQLRLGGAEVTIAGCAKGAGMIEPKMATMLAFIVTDAAVRAPELKRTLAHALPSSFNAITVDGDMSTNDTLLMLASGAAGGHELTGRDLAAFNTAAAEVAAVLARELVRDGEGATKLVTVEVRGARRAADAERIARQIANSPLVKTAFFGCDPNFGRIVMAAGKAGVALDLEKLEVSLGGIRIASHGALHTEALADAAARMKEREFGVTVDLRLGKARAQIVTCDLSYDYVKINAEYTT